MARKNRKWVSGRTSTTFKVHGEAKYMLKQSSNTSSIKSNFIVRFFQLMASDDPGGQPHNTRSMLIPD